MHRIDTLLSSLKKSLPALLGIALSAGLLGFASPQMTEGTLIEMKLNAKNDTVFSSIEEFEKNDSLVFVNPLHAQQYKLINYELRLLARPKELYHNVIRTAVIPKREINRYYTSAENTVTVFFSDIRIQNLKNNQILKGKGIRFKILKKQPEE